VVPTSTIMMNSVTDVSPSVSLLWLNMSFAAAWAISPEEESISVPPALEDLDKAGFCHKFSQITLACFKSDRPESAGVPAAGATASTLTALTIDTLQEPRILDGLVKYDQKLLTILRIQCGA
jgi:hypothetical protein